MQNQPMQMKGVADILANQGRYGDSMLVHMNPVEVQGLASLSPTGSLTVNPQTGQPEAFLPFLAPLLGGVLGSTALTGATIGGLTLGSTAAGAIGSGLATAIAEGDLKKGLISGITGFGIGSAMGNLLGSSTKALEAGADAATKATQSAKDILPSLEAARLSPTEIADLTKTAASSAQARGITESIKGLGSNPMSMGDRARALLTKDGIAKLATDPSALVGAAIGEGTNLDLDRREAMKAMSAASEADREYQEARTQAIIDQNVFPGTTMPAPAPAQDYSSYGTQYANAGGIVSLDPNDFRRRFNGLVEMDDSIQRMQAGGRFTTTTTRPVSSSGFPEFVPGMPYDPVGLGGTPSSRQQALRGRRPITPEELDARLGYTGMAGFGPEIKYFTDEDPFDQIIAPFSDTAKADPRLTDIMFDFNVGNITGDEVKKAVEAFEPKTEEATEVAKEGDPLANLPEGYDEYGLEYLRRYGVPMNFMAEGGETKNMPDQKTDRLISLAQQAIRGELEEEEADAIIQMFIDELGVEAFRALREVTLEEIVPGSQKEGEIVGQGGGMDDLVPGMIGNNQRLAASPGEYIVPADVVSGLGDGSTDAGVQELDGMLDRVRMERTATTQQPAPLPKGGVLPA
tara:strand:+ start:796 stop:2685 length:1890 start_codon:yes stop_codon:yes gene_type:complete